MVLLPRIQGTWRATGHILAYTEGGRGCPPPFCGGDAPDCAKGDEVTTSHKGLFLVGAILATSTFAYSCGIEFPLRDGRIAFISDRDGNVEIYTMKTDGTSVVRLTDNPVIDTEPSWSPDERKIAFCSDQDGDFEIYVMNADGAGVTNLTGNPVLDAYPAWSR